MNVISPLNIMKNVILASVIEPIPEKDGCTTRFKDWQEKSKLEYFIISGVNIGPVFYELAERIINNNYAQPTSIYDLAYKAQQEGMKNRNGGKINFGIIELLIPIITAQVVYDDYNISVLDKVETILKNTTKKDVEYHLEFRKIARKVSKSLPNTKFYDVTNMYEYYKINKNVLENNVHSEYINSFKRIKEAYNVIVENINNKNLLDCSVIAYNTILSKCTNFYGLAADYICVAIYLLLSNNPDIIII